MTDDELIARLAETPVEDWMPDEIERLRARLKENAALRSALCEHLLVETAFRAVLARPNVSASSILARADAQARTELVGRAARWAAVLLVVAGLGGGLYLYQSRYRDDQPRLAKVESPQPPLWPTGAEPQPSATPSGTIVVPAPTASATGTAAPSDVAPPTVPASDVVEPWVPMLAKTPRRHEELAFDDRRLSHDVASLGRWWDTVAGQQRPTSGKDQEGCDFDGTFKLRASWPADGVLTMATREWGEDTLRLSFWCGDRGVILENRQHPYHHWAAYVATKRPDQPLPVLWHYAAGDDDRGRRTGSGPIDFACADGRLFMSRGDVLLLSAPLPGPPDAVYLDCHAKLKAMGLARSTGVPDEWLAEPPPTWSDYSPETPLVTSLPDGARVERLGTAGLALSAETTTKEAWVALPITRPGIHEIFFDVESADPFTGVYVGDAEGKPLSAVGFFLELRTESLVLNFAKPSDGNVRLRRDLRKQGADPRVGFPLKLKLVAGPGVVKCFASADGRSWGRALEPQRGGGGAVRTVGVFCAPGRTTRSIRVTNVRFRTLLSYDEAIAGELPPPPKNYDDVGWFVSTFHRTEPDDVRFHRLVKAWAAGPTTDVARFIGYELAALPAGDLPRDVPKSLDADLDYVGRLAAIVDGWDANVAAVWTDRLLRSPEILEVRRDAEESDVAVHAPFSSVRKALVELTPATAGNVTMMPSDPIRLEIARMILDGDWDRLDRACRVWHRFGGREEPQSRNSISRPSIMPLIDWAAAQAERRLDAPDMGTVFASRLPIRNEWRHPLVEQFGKEGYNVLAELETALSEQAYEDACRIITGVTASQAIGLLPNAHDADLLTSLPGAVALAMKLHPDLRTTMQREYGDLALLRLRQATADGDVDAVRALTTQFFGTVAAAQAHMWLGDRALAVGDAPRAEGHYRTARREGSLEEAPAIDARLRLAAAWQGRDVGEPPTMPLRLGDATVSPAEFERVVSTLRGRTAVPNATSHVRAPSYPPLRIDAWPDATSYRLQAWAKLDGDAGKSPDQPPRKEVDYVAAQTAVAFTPRQMLVSNRFQLAAYDLADGKLAWRAQLGNEQGRTYQWLGVPMMPVVVDGRIFVRRLLAGGPELAALAEADGRVLWRSPRGEIIASDPLVAGDRVWVVTLVVPQPEMLELVLTSYDAATGRPLARRAVAQVRDYWRRELPCNLASAENMLVVSGAGCIVGCDADGEPRWTRRLTWLPTSVDPYVGPAAPTPPTVADDRVEIAQPGVPFRYVVDARTGSIVEQSVEVRKERPSPTASLQNAPVVEVADGRTLSWSHETLFRKVYRSVVGWHHGGVPIVTAPLGSWSKSTSSLGPVVAHDGRLWALPVDDVKKQSRKIVELVPDGVPQVGDVLAATPTPLSQWETAGRSASAVEAAKFFPAWELHLSRYDERTWLESRRFLDENSFVTTASLERPARWTRLAALPAEHRLTLHVRAASAVACPRRLVVRADGAVVFEREYAADDQTWHDERIDLTPLTGRTVALTVEHEYVTTKSTKTSLVAWQRLEIGEE